MIRGHLFRMREGGGSGRDRWVVGGEDIYLIY